MPFNKKHTTLFCHRSEALLLLLYGNVLFWNTSLLVGAKLYPICPSRSHWVEADPGIQKQNAIKKKKTTEAKW